MNRIYSKVSLYVLAALTSVSFAACSQEDLDNTSNDEVEMRAVTITASEASMSRTSYEDKDNYLSVNWKVGDVIYVGQAVVTGENEEISFNTNLENTGFRAFTATSVSENGKSATFEGELPADMTGTIVAVYGKKDCLKVSKGGNKYVAITGFKTQNWNVKSSDGDIATVMNGNLSEYDFLYSHVDNYNGEANLNFAFKHAGAVLKLNLAGLPANYTFEDGANVTISATGNYFYTYVNIRPDTKTDNGIQNASLANSINFNSLKKTKTDSNGKLVVYRTLPPTNGLTGDVTITVVANGETYTATIPGSDIEAGKFYYTPEITMK